VRLLKEDPKAIQDAIQLMPCIPPISLRRLKDLHHPHPPKTTLLLKFIGPWVMGPSPKHLNQVQTPPPHHSCTFALKHTLSDFPALITKPYTTQALYWASLALYNYEDNQNLNFNCVATTNGSAGSAAYIKI
jgi:hypothetical protein